MTISVSSQLSNGFDISDWQPGRWEEIIGNRALVRQYQRMVRRMRAVMEHGGALKMNLPPLLITGPSRSGKTAATKFMVRCLGCQKFNATTLNPCDGSCIFCSQNPEMFGLQGLFLPAPLADAVVPMHFTIIDSTKILSPEQLLAKLNALGPVYSGMRILYFDEVHRLQQRGMDEMLLKTVEDVSALWLFSTAKPEGLEDMFINRLVNITTELPSLEEMAHWIVDRCQEGGIPYEDLAVIRTIEKSNRRCGIALKALALAALNEDGLTLDLVENEWNPPS